MFLEHLADLGQFHILSLTVTLTGRLTLKKIDNIIFSPHLPFTDKTTTLKA